jgi:Fic family protein
MLRGKRYIHELADWPRFVWDSEALAEPVAEVRYAQGRHLGRLHGLGLDLLSASSLAVAVEDAMKSSAIEGERLVGDEVRSSVARRLGIEVAGLPEPSRQADGVVEMLLDATRRHDVPLTAERLFEWHSALFPMGHGGMRAVTVSGWRTDATGAMQVVSGPIGRERVHFQAPAAGRLEDEMSRFLGWFETASMDPVLKAGVAHLWFVTIHPFDDGNGRIGRAIADLAIARGDAARDRSFSLSSAIEAARNSYYDELQRAQRGDLDITRWLRWFIERIGAAIEGAESLLDGILHKAWIWNRLAERPVHERQRLVLNRLLDGFEGHLTSSKYAKLAKCSTDTALRDIRDLVAWGVLIRNDAGGRSTSYRAARQNDGGSAGSITKPAG